EGGKGNDLLQGGDGVDTYIFRRGDGQDVIDESGSRFDLNKLVLPDHVPADVTALRAEDGSFDIVLRLGRGGDIIPQPRLDTTNGRIQRIEFGNGVIWTPTELQNAIDHSFVPTGPRVIQGTSGADVLTGTSADEIYDGGDNIDRGSANPTNDRFIFARGGG